MFVESPWAGASASAFETSWAFAIIKTRFLYNEHQMLFRILNKKLKEI